MAHIKPKPAASSSSTFTHLVLPPDTNALGTLYGGAMMSWIDMAAAIVAQRHCRRIAVTASMDSLHFVSPVKLGDVVVIRASVNFTHNTSMEIGVRVESENPFTGERRHTASCYLTFVALDEAGKPTIVPPLKPRSQNEKRRFAEAALRRKERLKWKKLKQEGKI